MYYHRGVVSVKAVALLDPRFNANTRLGNCLALGFWQDHPKATPNSFDQ